jgi:hypothetical protein
MDINDYQLSLEHETATAERAAMIREVIRRREGKRRTLTRRLQRQTADILKGRI